MRSLAEWARQNKVASKIRIEKMPTGLEMKTDTGELGEKSFCGREGRGPNLD